MPARKFQLQEQIATSISVHRIRSRILARSWFRLLTADPQAGIANMVEPKIRCPNGNTSAFHGFSGKLCQLPPSSRPGETFFESGVY